MFNIFTSMPMYESISLYKDTDIGNSFVCINISHNSSTRIEHVLKMNTQFFRLSVTCARPFVMNDLFVWKIKDFRSHGAVL